MFPLSKKWTQKLVNQPETGMGYQIVSIILNDGKRINQVVVLEGNITQVKGIDGIPFKEEDIKEIIITHDKWNFNNDRKTPSK
jgi:hypothetical protein